MADAPVSGALSYIVVGLESTYGSVSGALAADKMIAFGHNQKITVDRNMNTNPVYGLGSPHPSKVVSGVYEGRLTITFNLASTYFMELVMGNCSDGGAAPKTHTYADNTGYAVTSFTTANGINLDTDSVYAYLGCVVDSCEMTFRVGEPVGVTLNVLYANETKATTGIDATPAVDAELPMVFSEGSVQLPSGTTLARVQSLTLRIIKNAELVRGLGSRVATAAVWKTTRFEFDMEISYENADLVADMYGQATGPLTATMPAGEASLVLTCTNSGAGSATRSLVFTLSTTYITSDSLPQSVEDHMVQTVRGFSINAPTSIIGSDNTATSPLVSS